MYFPGGLVLQTHTCFWTMEGKLIMLSDCYIILQGGPEVIGSRLYGETEYRYYIILQVILFWKKKIIWIIYLILRLQGRHGRSHFKNILEFRFKAKPILS